MKEQTMGHGLYIAVGFVCVSLLIAFLFPIVRNAITDATSKLPVVPSAMIVTPAEHTNLIITLPNDATQAA
ncbi:MULTISPECIES: hypothetical protein [unclassified Paenibacillus]|uniref:hypothetical protein n=1 Tax=unclassified Paenibacillus TaxID=185978 RepID=UPI0030F93E5A